MYFDVVTKKLILEEGKVVPLSNDMIFKNVVKNVVNRDFLAKIINLVTGLDYDNLLKNMIITDVDIPDSSIYLHHNEQDVIVTIDNKFINVEMSNDKTTNKRKNEITSHKYASNIYLKGSDYSDSYIFYQIAIENYNIFKNKDLITEVGLTDLKHGELETEEFKKFHVNLNNIPNKCYNELDERERYFKLFLIDDIKELEKISVGDNIMKKVTETIKSLNSNPIFMTKLEKEQLDKYCNKVAMAEERKEGEKIKQIEIAKKSLQKGIDINTVAEITELSIEELENLK